MPRINTVTRARKAQGNCGRCGAPINIGDGYRYIKFRYAGRRIRCMGADCRFRQSELTSSDKLSTVYGHQEDALDALDGLNPDDESFESDDLTQILQDLSDQISEVAEEYQASADAIREHFSELSTADECEEKANELEGWADELRDFEVDEFEFEDLERMHPEETDEQLKQRTDEARAEARQRWAEDAIDMARDTVNQCPV